MKDNDGMGRCWVRGVIGVQAKGVPAWMGKIVMI